MNDMKKDKVDSALIDISSPSCLSLEKISIGNVTHSVMLTRITSSKDIPIPVIHDSIRALDNIGIVILVNIFISEAPRSCAASNICLSSFLYADLTYKEAYDDVSIACNSANKTYSFRIPPYIVIIITAVTISGNKIGKIDTKYKLLYIFINAIAEPTVDETRANKILLLKAQNIS